MANIKEVDGANAEEVVGQPERRLLLWGADMAEVLFCCTEREVCPHTGVSVKVENNLAAPSPKLEATPASVS